MPLHLLGVEIASQTASHELLPSFGLYGFWERPCNSSDQSRTLRHLIIPWRDGLEDSVLLLLRISSGQHEWMAWQKPADPVCTDITATWGLLHRWRVMCPSPGASVALLWAVTFVPEWNFDSFLFLCCCFFFFLFFFFPLWSSSSLDFYSTVIKNTESSFSLSRDTWGRLVSAVNKTPWDKSFRSFLVNPSTSRSFAKNRKTFIFVSAESHTGLIRTVQVNTSCVCFPSLLLVW